MKIAITVADKALGAEVDPRFGRAKYFAIYETDNDSVEFIDNRINMEAPSGAGVQAASNVVSTGANVVITGNCGPKAFRTLSEGKVKVIIGARGSVSEVVDKFKKGELEYAESANVEGHW
jgi:predicted Fe-Mo cluster-binding NifX family protein